MTKADMNPNEIAEVWHLLDGICAPFGKCVRWSAIKATEPNKGDVQGGVAVSPAELVAEAEEWNPRGYNFYVQPNPGDNIDGIRSGRDNIYSWDWFMIDIDPPGKESPWVNTAERVQAAHFVHHFLCAYLGLNPAKERHDPLVLDSGRGLQLWYPVRMQLHDMHGGTMEWTVPPPVSLYAEDGDPNTAMPVRINIKHAVEIAQRFWLARIRSQIEQAGGSVFPTGTNVDPSCSDLPRLMRCPGTMNHKSGRLASIMIAPKPDAARAVVDADCGYTWESYRQTLATLLTRYVPAKHYTMQAPQETRAPGAAFTRWQEALLYANLAARSFVMFGAREPGRHQQATACARSLAEAGLDRVGIFNALVFGARRCVPVLDDVDYLVRLAEESVKRLRP